MTLIAFLRAQAAPLIALGLLAGVWVDRRTFHRPVGDAEAYHARLRVIADQLPYRIGDWVGTAVETPASAVELLRPNVLVGREFRDPSTGERATLVIVQCRDSRDMRGHWPPECYPMQGWILRDSRIERISMDFASGAMMIPVTVYRFTIDSKDRFSELLVYDFFVGPGGAIEDGDAGIRELAKDPQSRVFGAAQFQVVFEPSIREGRRSEIFRMLVTGIHPFIEGVRRGVTP